MSLSLFSPKFLQKLSSRFLSTAALLPTLLAASHPDRPCELRIALHFISPSATDNLCTGMNLVFIR